MLLKISFYILSKNLNFFPQYLAPTFFLVGPDGLEPSTPRLSSVCSNQLSYEPFKWWSRTGSNR